ncbi:MAG TPA: type III-A CRISPR-associated RAMP protein Csm4 [Clostridiales bacterium]|nr:type III-A CRISPR-associated RAMP protein Csm4 [Clostridiales bacterium]
MSYYLYKLEFTTPLHIGDSKLANGLERSQLNICADTLFSALCHTIIQFDGEEKLKIFVNKVCSNKILFSDTLPYKRDTLFIPKPYINSHTDKKADLTKRKLLKKLPYIPLLTLGQFMNSVFGKEDFNPELVDNNFAQSRVDTKVNIPENDVTKLYSVASVSFNEGCGLYGIIKAKKEDAEYITRLFGFLGVGGIGGKISSGYGKFKLAEMVPLGSSDNSQYQLLNQLLNNDTADYYISLTTALPTDHELDEVLDGATYNLIRRGGFMYSTSLQMPIKKQTQHCFCAGSVFRKKFEGDVYNVAPKDAPHPAYRYLKPLFLGVSI